MKQNPPPDTPLANLIVNIVLPVMILNKGGHYLSPRVALLLALCLPLGYGIQDYVRRRHKNYVSLIGLINIALTGGLALSHLHGSWFAIKDATLPLVLGLLTMYSAFTESPAARLVFYTPQILNVAFIEERLKERAKFAELTRLLKNTTLGLSASFFISAVLNFILASRIFVDIDPTLAAEAQERVLNEQIARMTWTGFGVIALPLMVFSGLLIYQFLRRLGQLTELNLEQLMKTDQNK